MFKRSRLRLAVKLKSGRTPIRATHGRLPLDHHEELSATRIRANSKYLSTLRAFIKSLSLWESRRLSGGEGSHSIRRIVLQQKPSPCLRHDPPASERVLFHWLGFIAVSPLNYFSRHRFNFRGNDLSQPRSNRTARSQIRLSTPGSRTIFKFNGSDFTQLLSAS